MTKRKRIGPPAKPTRVAAESRGARGPATGRPPLAAIAVGLLLVVVAGGWLASHFLARSSVPEIRRTADQNVLLITVDTWRADALGASGSGRVSTPNLDRLAALGTRFDFAHAQAVVTLPSHASILTGLYPFQHGVRENAGFRLPATVPTVAAALRSNGFATGAFIGSFALDSRFGLNRSFDVYDERYGQSNVNSGFTMPERRADAVVKAATAWIAKQHGKWFAWVHVFDPHAPYRPPAPFDREYAGQPYYGEVAFTDAALAPLLDAARDESGRPTLIVVTGDHGEALGEHGELTHGLFAYEPTLHVPLIVAQIDRNTRRWEDSRQQDASSPGGIRLQPDSTATVSHLPARHVDIVPTILDAVGIKVRDQLAGHSLLDGDAAGRGPVASYFEALSASFNRGWAPLTGVLRDREKFIDLPIAELYDLSTDREEHVNLAGRESERRRVLEAVLRQFGPVAPGERAGDDPEARARLQALGYVTGDAPRKTRYTEADDPKRLVALDAQIHRAVELYDLKRPREAIQLYEQIIQTRPGMELPYQQMAALQWEVGDTAQAIATLTRALRAGIGGTEVRTRLGTYLVESGNLKEGLPLLEAAAHASTTDVDALNALGIGLARTGRAAEAQATFEKILEVTPSNTLAMENLGSIALEQGRMDDARRFFVRALEFDPGSAQAHNGLGVVEIKAGNRKAAIGHWQRAVERDPQNFDALYNLATELVNDGRPAEARPFLEQFAHTAPPALYGPDIRRVRAMLARLAG